VVALARLLGADSPVDLPLVVLTGLVEHGQHYDRAIWSAPIRYPDRHPSKPKPQFPNLAFKVIGPRAAESGALLCQHPSDFIDPLVVRVTETVQPFADFGLQLKPV
jgi:hypothetical protein